MQTRDQKKGVLRLLEKEVNKPESEQNKGLIDACRLLVGSDKRSSSNESATRSFDELTKEVFLDYKNNKYSDDDIAKEFGISRAKMYQTKCEFGLVRKKEVAQ